MASSAPNKGTIPAPLNCPRCDSSNTKFCYYNNYSLSQPRHFCKACKRYWTHGGTLRNVPVGGGCRKNKRPRRRDPPSLLDPPSTQNQNQNQNQNPFFFGLPTPPTTTTPLELNFPFSSFRPLNTGFDLHPHSQINNALGLGFSNNNGGPFSNNNNSIFFGSSSSSSSPSATMASLLASKFSSKDIGAPSLMPYEDPQIPGTGKQGENSTPPCNWNPIDQINSSDPSSLLWNTTSNIAAWFDPSSIGSSVPSLI